MILADFPARSSCTRNCLFPVGGCSARQGRVLQARSEGSVRLYSTRAASEARREIARNAPPSVVFYETAVVEKLEIYAIVIESEILIVGSGNFLPDSCERIII